MASDEELRKLNERFGLGEALRFEEGEGGLVRAVASTELSRGEVYLHGAHVTAFVPAGEEPLLFLARGARFEEGKAIRGGVPICFPWFGAKAGDPEAPSHGLARTKSWDLLGSDRAADGGVIVSFGSSFGALQARYTVTFGSRLQLVLDVENRDSVPERVEAMLHSYLVVGDVREVQLVGLEGATYLDQLADRELRTERESSIAFVGETDRIYMETGPRTTVHDPVLGRVVVVEVEEAPTTVVWNPWIDKSARMGDLAGDEWPTMLCVETGYAAQDAVVFLPGASRRTATRLWVERAG